MKRKIEIGTGDEKESARRFIEAWKKAERGQPVETEERLDFEDMTILLRTMTPRRWELLKALRVGGPMSVRALARMLDRDYKNVHQDVRELERLGLISRSESSRVMVPWDAVVAHLRLAA